MVAIIGSNGRTVYHVTDTSCTCPNFLFVQMHIGGKCKHMVKVIKENLDSEQQGPTLVPGELDCFNDGIDFDEAFERFGDSKMKVWVELGEITQHKGKWLRLK